MSITPSILEVQNAFMRAAFSELHTCMPAEIVRVHEGAHKRQFVDVLPGLQRQVYGEDGELVDEALPIVPMVPVGYLQGGGFFISVPLQAGDIVLLVCAERSLDHWLETAKKGSRRAVVPGDVGTHTLEGAVALPCGPAPRAELLEGVDAADLVIARVGGPELRITPDGIVRVVGDLQVTGEIIARAGTPAQVSVATHLHNTAMGPSGPPNPGT
jgi:Phage protein Gp138 N-terminal domain